MSYELPPGITAEDVTRYKREVARCWIVAGLLLELPLEALDRHSSTAETVGPALHPDIWRTNAQAIMEDREMFRALAAAQRDVLTTSPSLAEIAPLMAGSAETFRPRLDALFREFFSRREVADIPPQAVLSALVRFIARLAGQLPGRQR